jgi:hypothetical protein
MLLVEKTRIRGAGTGVFSSTGAMSAVISSMLLRCQSGLGEGAGPPIAVLAG